jgi:hypothetical protein
VIGSSGAGVLDHDLRQAALQCLEIPREIPIRYASAFTWQAATQQFYEALVPLR